MVMKKLLFNESRECVFEIYSKRGYESANNFIQMLSDIEAIDINNRILLNEFLNKLFDNEMKNKKRVKQKWRIKK